MGNEGAENERDNSGELDEDVDGGAGGVLKRVTDGVTSDGGSLDILEPGGILGDEDFFAIVLSLDLDSKALSLNDLLGVIPSTTGVGGRESNLDSRNDAASEDAVSGLEAEEGASDERRQDDEEAGSDHLPEGGVSGDFNARLVVGHVLFLDAIFVSLEGGLTGSNLLHFSELSLDVVEHILSGVANSLHGHGGEPVGKHGSEEETGEGEGLKDVDVEGECGLSGNIGISISTDRGGNTGHESTEEGESDESSGADGETLADGSGGVAGSVEGVGVVADRGVEVGHLSNTASVVGDGAIAVNGEGNGEAAKHANGSEGNTIHGSDLEGDEDGNGEAEDGHDGGEVAKGEAVDDLGGGAVDARLGELVSGGALRGTSVVLSDETDEETRPETEDDASVSLPGSGSVGLTSKDNIEAVGKEEGGGDDHSAHENGGNPELDLEGQVGVENHFAFLFSLKVDVSEELADEGGTDANGGHDEREVHSLRGSDHSLGAGGDDEGGAGGLSERTEKISAHTGDVTNVITDVVSNGTGVERGVFGEVLADLASKISTDIGGLGVDTTTDSAEEGNGGTTETVAGDKLKDVGSLLPLGRGNGSGVGQDDDLKDEESEADEDEAKDLATLEGDLEALEPVDVAEVGGLDVAGRGHHHTGVATGHGGCSADEESEGSVGEVVGVTIRGDLPGHVNGTEHDGTEKGAEDGKSTVLFLQESDGSL